MSTPEQAPEKADPGPAKGSGSPEKGSEGGKGAPSAKTAPAGGERPYRDSVRHVCCPANGGKPIVVVLRADVASALQRTPGIFGWLRCDHCRNDRVPLGEFRWHPGGGSVP